MTEPTPHPASADVPARHDRLAAAMLTPLIDHGLREAVKWVMEPEILAIEAVVEKRVRARLATEFRDAAQAITDSGGENDDPLAAAIWDTCHQASSAPAVIDDPRTIAIAAYRHLADRLEGDTP
ncbi:hypothetical protein BJF79_03820 [Actinomadura sp. CNU-125]|uniref:hypothetical protein n=1 Tax=Actinomadura sp. CNU-125 TaxID=1904961 RepID=UPI000965514F|nr:hypothetical protein [Actinomadura sp. CNU-125]OLT13037.1 hypothetical protein BJF79_03820 [Actinomadura sp. CNU-125]